MPFTGPWRIAWQFDRISRQMAKIRHLRQRQMRCHSAFKASTPYAVAGVALWPLWPQKT